MDLSKETEVIKQNSTKSIPHGIGGWLIFVVIGLFATPIFNLYYVFNDLMLFFEPNNWIEFTTIGGEFYHPLFGTIAILELIHNISFSLLAIWLIILMYMKRKFFIKLMLIYLISALVLGLLFDLITNNIISSSIISSAIWIPYFIVSKRVKNTFVN